MGKCYEGLHCVCSRFSGLSSGLVLLNLMTCDYVTFEKWKFPTFSTGKFRAAFMKTVGLYNIQEELFNSKEEN